MPSQPPHVLRISQFAEPDPDTFRVVLSYENQVVRPPHFKFKLSPQDLQDLRWYLEDYLQYPLEPAPTIAARIEAQMQAVGEDIFRSLFDSNDLARRLWARLQPALNDTRIEIDTEVEHATAIPWELMRDPTSHQVLALTAAAFVRTASNTVQPPVPIRAGASSPIRILLVICRPNAGDDVPFRSVATRMLKGLNEEARAAFELEVLRPPTFEQLAQTLRTAKKAGKPYHVVHFDGHGMYAKTLEEGDAAAWLKTLGHLMLAGPREGSHGYLIFENPREKENVQLVDGQSLGQLLVETDVPVLVLNACRSAHADVAETSEAKPSPEAGKESEPHEAVRAYGSFAQEVMNAGVAGVVAMRYNVYVVTAAQFVADMYAALVRGEALGEAVTMGRKQLHAQPQREIAYKPVPLHDWLVPVVYENAPIQLFLKPAGVTEPTLQIKLDSDLQSLTKLAGLPKSPDVGFFGRDETLLALDRAFDSEHVVLLHAYAGSGKTATAAEFARWYALTGGTHGPILFTSFEQYKPLPRVLDTIEQVFGAELEKTGVNWLALTDDQRRAVALQLLQQKQVLWIWDNVEPVAGFPLGTTSAWSAQDQAALKDFLSDARDTRARFLLTSRRDETAWLGTLPRRIAVPRMPMQERVQLARALAEKAGHHITDVEDWRPLLQFTQGNPLTITVLVGQALRDKLTTREQITAFVDKLRKGESTFADEASEGRSKSLGASLSYGFENAFTERERRQLALLHFFQGFVNVDVLRIMGRPESDWCLPAVCGLTREEGIHLLDRAAEIGLLTAYGDGYYSIHPALPWYFKSLFDQCNPGDTTGAAGAGLCGRQPPSTARPAARAFAAALGMLGDYYHDQYGAGHRDVIGALEAEEANLLHARQLARVNGWRSAIIRTMQGLRALYYHTGRLAEWARLVHEIVPDFVDPQTDGPLAGREEEWSLVSEYRVHLAHEARQWPKAERLQRNLIEQMRQRVASVLATEPSALDDVQRRQIRTLVASLHEMGEIQRECSRSECVGAYMEALSLAEKIDEKVSAAVCAFNLGHTYKDIAALRDLAHAERWYRRSLELHDYGDRLGRGRCMVALGNVAYERLLDAREANAPEEGLLPHLNDALHYYLQALELLPADAVDDLGVTHNQLGNIYGSAGDGEEALAHYREAIGHRERMGDLYSAARTRFNVAVVLEGARRLADAREYARAALRNFETYGDRAAEDVEKTKRLIAEIEQDMKDGGK